MAVGIDWMDDACVLWIVCDGVALHYVDLGDFYFKHLQTQFIKQFYEDTQFSFVVRSSSTFFSLQRSICDLNKWEIV